MVQYANAGRYFGYLRRPAPVHMGPVVLYCTVAPLDATSPSQRTRARRRYRLRALACRRARHDMRAWRVRRTEQQANRVGAQMRASGESHLISGRWRCSPSSIAACDCIARRTVPVSSNGEAATRSGLSLVGRLGGTLQAQVGEG